MPQEVISISVFGGMITNPHKEDIPDNMAVYALNVDPQTELGTLRNILTKGTSYTANSVAIPDVYEADWLGYEVGGVSKWDLIYIDRSDDDISAIEDFYAVEASRTLTDLVTTGIVPRCIKTFNNQVQIGCGVDDKSYAVSRLLADKYFFNNGAVWGAGVRARLGECYNLPSNINGSYYVLGAGASNDSTGYFQSGILYRYATSIIYDGIQESNLVEGATITPSTQSSTIAVQVFGRYLKGAPTLIDPRTTAIKLYRAESSDDTTSNLGLYRLVKTIDINTSIGLGNQSGTANVAVTTTATSLTDTRLNMEIDAYIGNYVKIDDGGQKLLYVTSNTANTFYGTAGWNPSQPASELAWELNYQPNWEIPVGGPDHFRMHYVDNGSYPDGGAVYEEETGMPENLEFQSIRYVLNEVGGGFHWVANGEPEGESGTDWQRYIFRSKKFRPNMFDWARDFLVLPEIPNALAWYNDRLYAFSDNTVYRINPELMYIEDTFFGAGASHRQSVLVSEYGMYFCNLNGAYRIKDSGIDVISDTIAENLRTEGYVGFKSFANYTQNTSVFARVVIKAEVNRRLVLFLGTQATNATYAFGFYIPTGQWYAFSIGSTNATVDSGYYSGKDGEVYYSNGSASFRLFAGSTYEDSKWISKEHHLNEPSQNKSWNMIKWDAAAGTGTVAVKYNTEGSNPESGTTATSGAYINIYKKTFQIYITLAGNAVMDSIDIIVRRLFGKR